MTPPVAPTTLAEIVAQNAEWHKHHEVVPGSVLSKDEQKWLAARLSIAVHDTNNEQRKREHQMSLEVKGLADTIRQAKTAISKASDAAARMNASAGRLTTTLAQVEDMTNQLDSANADLQGAVATLSNGGPPLEPSK
jgi:cbb3-type cytochrome oxidase cytochrome c subunit